MQLFLALWPGTTQLGGALIGRPSGQRGAGTVHLASSGLQCPASWQSGLYYPPRPRPLALRPRACSVGIHPASVFTLRELPPQGTARICVSIPTPARRKGMHGEPQKRKANNYTGPVCALSLLRVTKHCLDNGPFGSHVTHLEGQMMTPGLPGGLPPLCCPNQRNQGQQPLSLSYLLGW